MGSNSEELLLLGPFHEGVCLLEEGKTLLVEIPHPIEEG